MTKKQLREYISSRANNEYRRYPFLKHRREYLIYRHDLHPYIRWALQKVKSVISWLLEKQRQNEETNKTILCSLGLSPDTEISKLDALYKKKFNKQKYMRSFKYKVQRDLPEPKKYYFAFIPKDNKMQRQIPAEEFLRTFKNSSK